MARACRLQGADCYYHILSRGDGRKEIYKSDRDREQFLNYINRAKEKYGFYLHAYCLMPNHYHLLIETPQPNLSRIMQYLNTSYTVYYNVKWKKSGHLFQGRYKSILIEKDSYYGELTRYIHLNPVRANLEEEPEKYSWSSYKAYLSGKSDGYVDIERVRQSLGMAASQYRKYVEATRCEVKDPLKQVYAGFLLGGVDFIKEKLEELGNEQATKEFSYKRQLRLGIDPAKIIAAVGKCYKQSEEEVRYGKKRPYRSRQLAIYLMRGKTSLTNKEIGAMFKMKEGAVIMAGKVIERLLPGDKVLQKKVKQTNNLLFRA